MKGILYICLVFFNLKQKTVCKMKNESEQQLKRNSVVCPKCGQRTSFNLIQDAIDDEGEFYCCQHCGWPFHYKVAI